MCRLLGTSLVAISVRWHPQLDPFLPHFSFIILLDNVFMGRAPLNTSDQFPVNEISTFWAVIFVTYYLNK